MDANENQGVEVAKVFMVLEGKLEWFKAQMAKLAKRAAKLRVEAPAYSVGEHVDVEEHRERADWSKYTVVVRKFPVTISGKAPKFAGWTLAATLQHLEGGETLIRSILEEDAPIRYRTAAPDCAHCNSRRRRNDTYLVKHDDGSFKQVGSNCIHDFLGHQSPEHFAAQAEYLAEAFGFGEGSEEGGGAKGIDRVGISSLLAVTCASIRAGGWTPRSKARWSGAMATADHVWSMLFPFSNEDKAEAEEFFKAQEKHAAKDDEKVRAALDWILGMEGDLSDYLHNIRAVARSGSVDCRMAGYAASIVPAYDRARGEEQERLARPESKHQGAVGERITRDLTVRSVRFLEGYMGGSTALHTFSDAEGNDYKWFATSSEYAEGSTVKLTGTVKKHDEWKGRKQTVLTRCVEFVEKPKKNKANKELANMVVVFMNFAVGDLIKIGGVEEAFGWLLEARVAQESEGARGVSSFFHGAAMFETWRESAGVGGLERWLTELRRRATEGAAVVGDCLSAFFRGQPLSRHSLPSAFYWTGANLDSFFYRKARPWTGA